MKQQVNLIDIPVLIEKENEYEFYHILFRLLYSGNEDGEAFRKILKLPSAEDLGRLSDDLNKRAVQKSEEVFHYFNAYITSRANQLFTISRDLNSFQSSPIGKSINEYCHLLEVFEELKSFQENRLISILHLYFVLSISSIINQFTLPKDKRDNEEKRQWEENIALLNAVTSERQTAFFHLITHKIYYSLEETHSILTIYSRFIITGTILCAYKFISIKPKDLQIVNYGEKMKDSVKNIIKAKGK